MSLVFISLFNFAKNLINNFFTNIFALFKKKNKKELNFDDGEEYFALIKELNGKLYISIIDAETEEEDFTKSFLCNQRYKTPKVFVNALSKIFTKKNFKAVLLCIFDLKPKGFSTNLEFCKVLKDYFDSVEIPYYFISEHDWILSSMLVAAKVKTIKMDENVLFVFVSNSQFNVYVYRFKGNGFQRISSRKVSANQRAILIRQEIIGSDNPVKIFATPNQQNQPWKTGLRKIKFKMDGFVFIAEEDIYNTDAPTIELSKWIINNKRNTKYYILPSCERTSVVFHGCNKEVNAILTAKCNDTLPFIKVWLLIDLLEIIM
uniref:Uncharacterized protein n=1 Tax=Panagrolaimus davidi TaxID=227884 RepID=A0A914QXQ5_9BILA